MVAAGTKINIVSEFTAREGKLGDNRYCIKKKKSVIKYCTISCFKIVERNSRC